MKTLKTIILLVFATATVWAQDLKPTEVPEVVKITFTKEFPNATDVEWERDKAYYKVEFDVDWMDHEVWYTEEGMMHRKEQEIAKEDLPEAVLQEIGINYSEYFVDDVKILWYDNTTTYKVELESGDDSWEVVFDVDGRVLEERID
ncbi:MAG TPA: PepSY-like domain-containing protein [Flavobacteriaceae bacterium]|nr:PepSY-like domain-containing protein [Flavobacteriaceae bacterium]